MNTITCTTCGTQLMRHEAVLRGNAIDPEPTAWCRRDAVAAGILVLPMPSLEPSVPAPRKPVSLRERLFAQR
jgi:hypothetical protein